MTPVEAFRLWHVTAVAFTLCFAATTYVAASSGSAAEWEYAAGGQGANLWPTLDARCNGSHQSPVRLQGAIYNASLRHISFEGYHQGEGHNFTLLHDGHSAKLKLPMLYQISGGSLKGRYRADSLHFHWGRSDGYGSEHTFNGVRFPMEMHIVHLHENYSNMAQIEANGTSDSIAVTGFLFKLVKKDNVFLQKIVDGLQKIDTPDQQLLMQGFPLDNLMPSSHHYYYRYEGSLTSPSCVERVVWTVFIDKIGISAAQLERFRSLKDKHGSKLYDNFRPEQPLNDRHIYTNMETPYYPEDIGSKGATVANNVGIFISKCAAIHLIYCMFTSVKFLTI